MEKVFEIEDVLSKVHIAFLLSLNSSKSQFLELAFNFVAGNALDSRFLSLIRLM